MHDLKGFRNEPFFCFNLIVNVQTNHLPDLSIVRNALAVLAIIFLSSVARLAIGRSILPSDIPDLYQKLRAEKNTEARAILYQDLSVAYFTGGFIKPAFASIDTSLQLLKAYDSLVDLKANAMIIYSLLLAKSNDLTKASQILAYYHSKGISDSIRAKAALIWVDNLARQGRSDTAMILLNKIRNSAYINSRAILMARFYLLEALLRDNKSQFKEAASLYFKALEIARKENDLPMLSRCYNNIGSMYVSANQSAVALKYLHIADSLYHLLGDDLSVLNTYNNIALVYKDLKNFNLSKKYYEKIIVKAEVAGDKVSQAIAYFNLGNVLEALNQIDSAEAKYKSSLELSNQIGLSIGRMYNSYGLGMISMEKKHYAEAIRLFEYAFNEALKIPDYSILVVCADSIAFSWSLEGQNDKAYEWMKISRKYNDLQMKNNEIQAVEKLRADYEESQVVLENKLLKINNEKTYYRLKYQQYLILIAILAGVVFMLLLLIQYRSFLRVNRLNKELRSQKTKTDEQNHRLELLNADLEVQQAQMKVKSQELEKSLALKDKMISIISHDLRAPLVSLGQLVKFALNTYITREEFVQITTQLQDQVENNLSLIDNLVIWSRTGIQGRPETKIAIALAGIIQQNISLYQSLISDKRLNVQVTVPDKVGLYLEPEAFSMIIRNLLSNAIKFSHSDGVISISANNHDQFFELSVADQGIGIDNHRLETLFKKTQGASRGTGNEHGFGIGLVFIHELLQSCGGEINVSSSPGGGTTFFVKLPV